MNPKKIIAISLLVLLSLTIAPISASASAFDFDLYYGIRESADVSRLQEFLTEQEVYTGPITGNFYSLTLRGVKDFQTKLGITPAFGYFGPITRASANEIIDAQVSESDEQAISEIGTTPIVPEPPKNLDNINESLLEQIALLSSQLALLQLQLNAQQATQESVDELTTQIESQTQTIEAQNEVIQQIQQNTIPTVPPAPVVIVPPSPPKPTIISFTGDYQTGLVWSSENARKCSIRLGGVDSNSWLGQKSHWDGALGKWVVTTFHPANGIFTPSISGWVGYFGVADREVTLECFNDYDEATTTTIIIYKP
jgi:peptidoglycan hydrolase-like protein with peptidoglycan-binding domain